MSSKRDILFIVNPAASGGRAAYRWKKIFPLIQEQLDKSPGVIFTASRGDAQNIAHQAALNGDFLIVAVGGDGTINEVVNGLLSQNRVINQNCALAVLPMGTGCDFARTLKTPNHLQSAINTWLHHSPHWIDVGLASYVDADNLKQQRYFCNILSFGISSQVVWNLEQSKHRFGPKITYLSHVIRALLQWRNLPAEIAIDEGSYQSLIINTLACANARYFGGGMLPAPSAEITDGLLDMIHIGDISKLQGITSLPRLLRGTLTRHPEVQHQQFTRLSARSDIPFYLELDGELVGYLPVEVKAVPGVLPVVY